MQSLFLPFVVYFLAFNLYATYFHSYALSEMSTVEVYSCIAVLGVWALIFVKFALVELAQLLSGPITYIKDFWNIMDAISLVSCAFYILLSLTTQETPSLNVLGAFSCFLLWIKLFYWMRLFKAFSAFIRIITTIIADVQVFLVMLLMCLSAFANVLLILDDNRVNANQSMIVESYIGIAPIDALLHAYLTGLGEFGMDNYSDGDKYFTWIMFLFATLLVQLIFMNMLIAIMSDSFARISAI